MSTQNACLAWFSYYQHYFQGYYVRTDDYFPIRNQEKKDVFEVPMIHSTFLIDLTKKKSASIQFWPLRDDYNLLLDDIIVFSKHAKSAGL